MLKTLGAQVGEFKKDSFLTPVFMVLEVLMETIIPLMMASIIDNGVEAGSIRHIFFMGFMMIVAAGFSLFAGAMGGTVRRACVHRLCAKLTKDDV